MSTVIRDGQVADRSIEDIVHKAAVFHIDARIARAIRNWVHPSVLFPERYECRVPFELRTVDKTTIDPITGEKGYGTYAALKAEHPEVYEQMTASRGHYEPAIQLMWSCGKARTTFYNLSYMGAARLASDILENYTPKL